MNRGKKPKHDQERESDQTIEQKGKEQDAPDGTENSFCIQTDDIQKSLIFLKSFLSVYTVGVFSFL